MKFSVIRGFSGLRALAVGSALLLPACSFTEEALWPSLTGEDPAGAPASSTEQATAPAQPAATTPAKPLPVLGANEFKPAGVTPGPSTGTYVGKKVIELRAELSRLQASISQNNASLQQLRSRIVQDSQRYHATVANINT
ncbi:MAG: hypothetical protein ACTSV1_05485, partial [Alphaproteobacteria bacterium]